MTAELIDILTPALVVDPTRMDANIAAVQDEVDARRVALRPHWKTSKCLEVARRQRDSGAIGFTCATAGEAASLLAEPDLGEILWANLPIGPAKARFAAKNSASGRLIVGVDSLTGAQELSDAAAEHGSHVSFLIEVDTGSGRAGVAPHSAVELWRAISGLPRLRFRGVFTFEGGAINRRIGDRDALAAGARSSAIALVDAASALESAGAHCEIVSAGSTPGLHDTSTVEGITEIRPGTYVYYDGTQVVLQSAEVSECAVTVLTRVISAPRAGTVIIDAGSKAMSSDRRADGNGMGIVCTMDQDPIPDVTFTHANEEHGWIEGPGTERLEVGDLLRIVPNHACATVNLWSRIHVVPAGSDRITDTWNIIARY